MNLLVCENVRYKPEKIKEFRGSSTLEEFAAKTELKPDFLSKLERGKRNPSIETIEQLCNKLKVTPNDFFEIIFKNA